MIERCRSCGARIEWARTVKNKRIPLDPGEREGGNILVTDGVAAIVPELQRTRPLRTSHFATCPNADVHRRRY